MAAYSNERVAAITVSVLYRMLTDVLSAATIAGTYYNASKTWKYSDAQIQALAKAADPTLPF